MPKKRGKNAILVEGVNPYSPVAALMVMVIMAMRVMVMMAIVQVRWVEERKFWMFESVMALVAGVSYGLVFLRQKQQVGAGFVS